MNKQFRAAFWSLLLSLGLISLLATTAGRGLARPLPGSAAHSPVDASNARAAKRDFPVDAVSSPRPAATSRRGSAPAGVTPRITLGPILPIAEDTTVEGNVSVPATELIVPPPSRPFPRPVSVAVAGPGDGSQPNAPSIERALNRMQGQLDELVQSFCDWQVSQAGTLRNPVHGPDGRTSTRSLGIVGATPQGAAVHQPLEVITDRHDDSLRIDNGTAFEFDNNKSGNRERVRGQLVTKVYRPQYIDASELLALVQPLLTEAIGSSRVTNPSQLAIAAVPDVTGVQPFVGRAALLVQDFEAVIAEIDRVVARHDVPALRSASKSRDSH